MAAGSARSDSALALEIVSDLEIKLTRAFDAPRTLVFKTMIDPQAIPKWWGPKGSTTIVDKMDVRRGGEWRFKTTMSNGKWTAFRGVYNEIAPPERLEYTFEWEGLPGHVSTESITLIERDGWTTVTNVVRFTSIEDRDGMLRNGMEKGANESMDRLAALLQELQGRG
jgi:uncharacterized protein YndB with AHSA1/START domain